MNEKKFLLRLWSFGIIFIVLAYFFIDRPIADLVYRQDWRMHLSLFKNIIEWPPLIGGLAPLILLLTLLFRSRPATKWQLMLITLCFSVLVAYFFKNDLKWIFSRYWPETWKNNNLSWINNHAYGFQWFQGALFQVG